VFDTLIESKRRADVKRGSTASVVSILFHSALVAGAVYATQQVVSAEEVTIDTAMVYLSDKQEEEKPEEHLRVIQHDDDIGLQAIHQLQEARLPI